MTEEIIIDGINVRDCNRCNPFHYDRGVSEYPICLTSCEQWGGFEHYCNQRPDCYYKQLKRLEKERDELKEKYFLVEQESINKSNTICELKQENEMLKQENRLLYKELREIRDRLTEVLGSESK